MTIRARLLAVNPVALVLLAPSVMALVLVTQTRADPDLWGHLIFGRDIAAAWAIPSVDPYSFTSDRPWVNHEWLAELIMYGVFSTAGASGLVLFKALIAIATITLVVQTLGRHRPSVLLVQVVLWLTLYATLARIITIRPQIFSLLAFAGLLVILSEIDRGRLKLAAALPPLMALWANLHGGWVVGVAALGVWTLFRIGDRSLPAQARAGLAAASLISLLSTLANPYGIGLWRFLYETVGLQRSDILDWAPMTQFPVAVMLPWSLVTAIAIWSAVRSGARPPAAYVLIAAGLGIGAARVNRLDAFFALSVLILFAPQIVIAWKGSARKNNTASPVVLHGAGMKLDRTGVIAAVTLVIAVPLVAVVMAYERIRCIEMSSDWFPEPEAVTFVASNRLQGRMLTWFDWGEYAIWHLAPAITVSIDGRRETVYSDGRVSEHLAYYRNLAEARDLPARLQADYIWLPRNLPAAAALSPPWTPVFEGPVSTVWARAAIPEAHPVPPSLGPRCFPGP